MYACIPEIGGGFFEGVCALSNTTTIFHDPPHLATAKNLSPGNGLRPEVDHAPRYRERRFSLG
jgi:hypothetical protein